MVFLPELWLPILLSAVIVFIASSIIHMVLPYHKSDYRKLPNEEKALDGLRSDDLTPGTYHFPYCADMKQMKSPEMMDKYKKGPIGLLTVMPSGPMNMGKYLGQWFVFCLLISFMTAYLAGRTVAMGAPYLSVFRVAGTAAFLGYGAAHLSDSIWKGQLWSTTAKHVFDGLVYALLTAGTFGWLWPR